MEFKDHSDATFVEVWSYGWGVAGLGEARGLMVWGEETACCEGWTGSVSGYLTCNPLGIHLPGPGTFGSGVRYIIIRE